jgi:hypothetical protein
LPFNLLSSAKDSIIKVIKLLQKELKNSRKSRKESRKERREFINLMQELREEKINKVSYSSISSAQFSTFCAQSGFTVQSLQFKGNLPKKEIPAFKWTKHAESFVEQRENILKYLREHLEENSLQILLFSKL